MFGILQGQINLLKTEDKVNLLKTKNHLGKTILALFRKEYMNMFSGRHSGTLLRYYIIELYTPYFSADVQITS